MRAKESSRNTRATPARIVRAACMNIRTASTIFREKLFEEADMRGLLVGYSTLKAAVGLLLTGGLGEVLLPLDNFLEICEKKEVETLHP